jgi:hypothetical protein
MELKIVVEKLLRKKLGKSWGIFLFRGIQKNLIDTTTSCGVYFFFM